MLRGVVAGLALAVDAPTFAQQPRVPDAKSTGQDIDVQATGCLSGDTLVKQNLDRNPSNPVPNPARRWRLRLTGGQGEALKTLDPKRQVEVWGVVDRHELESGLAARACVGRVGAESKKTPASAPMVLPTPTVDSITQTQDRCP